MQVALLAQGVLDADVYPEVARGILSALWLASANPSPQARLDCLQRDSAACLICGFHSAAASCSLKGIACLRACQCKDTRRDLHNYSNAMGLMLAWYAFLPVMQVRRQAYASLAEYSFELLEQLEALPPLIDFVDLLVAEQHPGNTAACEALVIRALAHEHAT